MLHLLFTVSQHITVLLHTNKQLLSLKNMTPLMPELNPTILLLHILDIRHVLSLNCVFLCVCARFAPQTHKMIKTPAGRI